jgi:circadian clock protein KaiB
LITRGIAISDIWVMRLYIAGETEASRHAVENLRDICDKYLKDRCEIDIVDLKKHPELAVSKQIFAIPTLVKELPLPVRRLIGDLHATEKVLIGLDLYRKSNKNEK